MGPAELAGSVPVFISGTVPTKLVGGMQRLELLYLSHNNLSGTVPAELASITKLAALRVNRNRLSGTVPDELASRLTELKFKSPTMLEKLKGTLRNLLPFMSTHDEV